MNKAILFIEITLEYMCTFMEPTKVTFLAQ